MKRRRNRHLCMASEKKESGLVSDRINGVPKDIVLLGIIQPLFGNLTITTGDLASRLYFAVIL